MAKAKTKVKKRVLIGMSGGVDSSVAAALLLKQGYDVIGITMQLLPKEYETKSSCCNLDAIHDAKKVANKLGIPHYTINIRDHFKANVIDYFIDSYIEGDTPNPCVECNRHIKFDELAIKAKELGADFVATGHYCKRTKARSSDQYYLSRGKDPSKDQSYFLYMLTSKQLETTLFPLGGYLKSEIRELAKEFGLATASKAESQEICFVTEGNYKTYIQENLEKRKPKPGFIVDTSGNILGEHTGLYQFTIGQRKGLGITTAGTPLYVVDINKTNNTVIVGAKEDCNIQNVTLKNVTLVNDNFPVIGKTLSIKTRYQMQSIKGKIITLKNGKAMVKLESPKNQISPGQSLVFYNKDRVIGGGIIDKRES